jgi:Ala-tRNA(Pro) deacylase
MKLVSKQGGLMTISARVDSYLKDHSINYQIVNHHYSEGAYNTAVAAHIPTKKLAKAVLLIDHDGKHLLAILPSSNILSIKELSEKLDRELQFVQEQDLGVFFTDCAFGAIPAVGQAYNISVIWDDHLKDEPDIYIEGGDHEALIHMDKEDFMKLMADQPHMIISEPGGVLARKIRHH